MIAALAVAVRMKFPRLILGPSCSLCILQQQVNELSDPVVETFECGKFTDDFRKMCSSVLEQGVSVSAVNPVITAVLGFANKVPSRLPSQTFIRQLVVEARAIAHMR